MSLFIKKEEIFLKMQQHDQAVVHFVNDEANHFWYVTLCNQDIPFYTGILMEEDGLETLLQFCLLKRDFSLKRNLDTLEVLAQDKILGYVRVMKNDHIITERENLAKDFLYQMMCLLEKRVGHLYVKNKSNRFVFEGNQLENSFTVNLSEEQVSFYLMKRYLSEHPTLKVKETDEYYFLETITFEKGVMDEYSKTYVSELLSTRQTMSSSLLYDIYCSIHQNQRLVRRKKGFL